MWLALHSSFSFFILQDSECAEAELGIAQTTMGIFIIQVEGVNPGDEMYADVGVVLEGVDVLQNFRVSPSAVWCF